MGWLSRTKKSPVMQPLQNSTANSSKTTTGTLNAKNNFGETTQVIRQIKNCEPHNIYRADKLNLTADQYGLLNHSLHTRMCLFLNLSRISRDIEHRNRLLANGTARAVALADRSTPQSAIDRKINECVTDVYSIQKNKLSELNSKTIDKQLPLINDSYDAILDSCEIFKNKALITSLSKNPEARFFSKHESFAHTLVIPFYMDCLTIASGKVDSIEPESRRGFLRTMGHHYARKGILENQLPAVKIAFEKIKNKGKLDKNFISVVGQIIKETEVCLKNMNDAKRSAIFETFAPPMRPKKYELHDEDNNAIDYHKSILWDKTDEEIINIINELKAIPLLVS
ncbi:MAG: hypothetical protein AAHH96_02820 [Candidatus Symbiodolus clandestinus]